MSKPVYIAAYNQSKFGKLMDMTVPQIVSNAVIGVCEQIRVSPSSIDVAAVGSACNFTLNKQGLLSGLVATVPGMAAKPIESVENACASGGQAVLSVIYKLLSGVGDVGVAAAALPCCRGGDARGGPAARRGRGAVGDHRTAARPRL